MAVDDAKDGTYPLSFSSAVAGEVRLVVRLDNHEMHPLTVNFVKAAHDIVATNGDQKKDEVLFQDQFCPPTLVGTVSLTLQSHHLTTLLVHFTT